DTFSINSGDLLSLLCAFACAFDIFYTIVFVKKEDALALTIVQFITAAILSIIGMVLLGEVPTTIAPEGIYVIIYLAIFCTFIAYVCQNVGMQYANPTKSAIILSMEALFGTLFSVWLLSEMLTDRMIVGCVLILCAVLFAEVKPGLSRRKVKV
ncbi:MAG: DMT family transporter, partial [Lysinibacillus sp.]